MPRTDTYHLAASSARGKEFNTENKDLELQAQQSHCRHQTNPVLNARNKKAREQKK